MQWNRFAFAVVSVLLGMALLAGPTIGEESGPSVLVAKQIVSSHLVEQLEMVLRYSIYNVGESAVSNIEIDDHGLASDRFSLLSGSETVRFEGPLEPADNVSFSLHYRPLFRGSFNLTASEVRYTAAGSSKTVKVYSSNANYLTVLPYAEYSRLHSSHVFDWITFSIISLPSLVVPYALFHKSKTYYETFRTGSAQ